MRIVQLLLLSAIATVANGQIVTGGQRFVPVQNFGPMDPPEAIRPAPVTYNERWGTYCTRLGRSTKTICRTRANWIRDGFQLNGI